MESLDVASRNDRIKRAVAFYISVALFFILLPIVLSYSLGYKIDYKNLEAYKTGLLYLRSYPAGAEIYLNGKRRLETTPSRIEEMKPGVYDVEVKKSGFYPWRKNVLIRPNMVIKLENIVLFSVSQEPLKVRDREVLDFVASDKDIIYCMTDSGLVRTNMDGSASKRISSYSNWPKDIKGRVFSPDKEKLAFFNNDRIWVAYLNLDTQKKTDDSAKIDEVYKSEYPILNVFWYSQSNYLVFVRPTDISAIELHGEGVRNTATLYRFLSPLGSRRTTGQSHPYYDMDSDSLYFTDAAKGDIQQDKLYIYRLDLRQRFLDAFMERFKKDAKPQNEKKTR